MAGRRRTQKTEYYFDYSLLFIILFLTGFGLVMIYSASAYDATTQNLNEDYYLMHQAFAAALGLVGMFFVSHIPYHFWERFAVIGYVVSLILIALVLSPLGVEVNGARRWLNLGMSIQPAEIAKLAMILFLATFICKMGRNIRTSRGFLTVIGVSLPHVFCIWKITNNLSSAIIVLGIAILMLFVASPQYKPFFIIGGIGALAVIGVIFGVKQLQSIEGLDFRFARIMAWLDPEAYASGKGFQTLQALYAIGSGGIFGKGLGQSIQKLGFLPEQQNDMIFSIICEELGLFGGIAVILIFFAVDLASDDYCEQRVGSVRCAVSCRRAGAYRDSGHFKCCGRNELNAEHRRVPAVYQLRRLIDPVFADRDGARHERCPRHQGPGCVMVYARIVPSPGAKKTSVLSGHGWQQCSCTCHAYGIFAIV